MLLGMDRIIEEMQVGSIVSDGSREDIRTSHIDVRLGRHYWSQRIRKNWLYDRLTEIMMMRRMAVAKDVLLDGNYIRPGSDDPKEWFVEHEADADGNIILLPHSMTLCHTEEFIGTTVPRIVPNIDTRSTAARFGFQVHLAAGIGDAGFTSRWTLEVYNTWSVPVVLRAGERIACIRFWEVTGNEALYSGAYNATREQWTPEMMLPKRNNLS